MEANTSLPITHDNKWGNREDELSDVESEEAGEAVPHQKTYIQ